MATERKTASAGTGFLGGLALALVLLILYIKFGFQLPGWVQPKARIEAMIKDVVTDREDPAEPQRLVSVQLGLDSAGYVEADTALGGFLTREMIWQKYTRPQIARLRGSVNALDDAREKHAVLADALDRALDRQLKPLVEAYLDRRCPAPPGESHAERLNGWSGRSRPGRCPRSRRRCRSTMRRLPSVSAGRPRCR